MLSLIFGPGRVDQSGPSSRVGPNAREGQYSSQQYIYIFFFFFFFLFLTCPHKRGERGIRTSNLCFMMHGLQPIELPHEDIYIFSFEREACAPSITKQSHKAL